MCLLNAPGTFHDSTMADYGIYDKCEKMYERNGGKIVVDSAFKLQGKSFMIQSSQSDPVGCPHGVLVNRAATSVRQLSEHGMCMIQGAFPTLKDKMTFETFGER